MPIGDRTYKAYGPLLNTVEDYLVQTGRLLESRPDVYPAQVNYEGV